MRLRSVHPWSVLWLTVVWLALWGTVSPLTVVGGVLVAVAVLVVFPMPRLRVAPWYPSPPSLRPRLLTTGQGARNRPHRLRPRSQVLLEQFSRHA